MKSRLAYLVLAMLLLSLSAFAQMQSGTFTFDKSTPEYTLDQNKGDRVAQIEIAFPKPFDAKPEIVIAVSMLDASKDTNVRYAFKTIGVSRDGFTLQVKTWEDTKIHAIGGTWIAYVKK